MRQHFSATIVCLSHCLCAFTGAMFSIMASGEAFFDLIASAVWPNVYNATIDNNLSPGTSFLIMAGVAFIGVPLVV